ncbi:hypothetical protein DER46DRAFT_583978 [Fusarium sp. MPI-SDFR-AT-0072]|nr:hypothetical protein DER46DRAFT_583978 [Fusarium sp. MPI-SDFR-AT-0072]
MILVTAVTWQNEVVLAYMTRRPDLERPATELGFGCQRTNRHQGYAHSLVCGSLGYPSSRMFLAHVRKVHSSSETNEDESGYRWSSPLVPEQFIVM